MVQPPASPNDSPRPAPARSAPSTRGAPAAAVIILLASLAMIAPAPGPMAGPGSARGQQPTTGAAPSYGGMTDTERGQLLGELRDVYSAWRSAILRRHAGQWQATTSEHRRHQVHNEIVSNGGAYPDALFQVIQAPPQLGPLRIVDVRLGTGTARLTFFGQLHYDPVSAPDPATPQDLMHVVFHQGPDGWAIDGIAHVSLENRPDWRRQFMNLDYSALAEPAFRFDKAKPETPPLCEPPENVAMLQVFAHGYRVTAEINGYRYPEVNDGSVHFIVIGGLNNGPNRVELEMQPVGDDDPLPSPDGRHLAVNLWVRAGQPGEDSSRVFHYMPRPGQAPPRHTANVEVNPRTLAEGRR